MTPQEKAKELLHRFYCVPDARGLYMMQEYQAKECALIAVDEILNYQSILLDYFPSKEYKPTYYQEVKKEIEKL